MEFLMNISLPRPGTTYGNYLVKEAEIILELNLGAIVLQRRLLDAATRLNRNRPHPGTHGSLRLKKVPGARPLLCHAQAQPQHLYECTDGF